MDKSNFEIKHDGKRYERDTPRLRLVCTDFREVVTWTQGYGGSSPQKSSVISGSATIDKDRLLVLGHPNSKTHRLHVSLRPVSEEVLADRRSLIDLSTKSKISDPKPEAIAASWPLAIGYTAAWPEENMGSSWYIEVYVPEAEYEKIRAVAAPRMDLSIEIAAYGEPAELALGVPWGRDLFLPGKKTGSAGGHFGRCLELRFTLEGAERYAAPGTEDDERGDAAPQTLPMLLGKIERRLGEAEKHQKKVVQVLTVLAVAGAAIAVHLWFG
jgi:hypothetical protein